MKKKVVFAVFIVALVTVIMFVSYRYIRHLQEEDIIRHSCSNLMSLGQALIMYNHHTDGYWTEHVSDNLPPYVKDATSDELLNLLTTDETPQNKFDYRVPKKLLYLGSKFGFNDINYETFNFTREQWQYLDKYLWKHEVQNIAGNKMYDELNRDILESAPFIWEKKVYHKNRCVVYLANFGTPRGAKNGKLFLEIINAVKRDMPDSPELITLDDSERQKKQEKK